MSKIYLAIEWNEDNYKITFNDIKSIIENTVNVKVTENPYKKIADHLWKLLNDIDTGFDLYKLSINSPVSSFLAFLDFINNKHKERFKYVESDGYDLFLKKET